MLRSALEDPDERRETLALTLKVFDDHPEYIDELLVMAREHPVSFGRLLDVTAKALEEPAFAQDVGARIAEHPVAVEQVTRVLLAESERRPELRRAIAQAILGSDAAVAQILREHPEIVQRAMMRTLSQ